MRYKKLSAMAAVAILGVALVPQEASALPLFGGLGGNFDENVSCSYTGTNSVTPVEGGDPSAYTYSSNSAGTCTWTATQKGKNKPDLVETANCTTQFNWPVTRGACVAVGNGEYAVSYTGNCQSDVLPVEVGRVSCPGAGFTNGNDGVWLHGFGVKGKGQAIVGASPEQCTAFDNLYGGKAFTYTEYFANSDCSGPIVRVDDAAWFSGHSHSWSSADQPYIDTDKQGNVIASNNTVSATETGEIGPVSADTDPTSFDLSGGPSGGTLTFRVLAVPQHAGTVAVDLALIDENSIEVNGVAVIPGSCNRDNSNPPSRLSCSVSRYVNNAFIGGSFACGESPIGKCAEFTGRGNLTNGQTFVTETVRAIITAE